MNICIVTVYDSLNSGSYWQAYTLGKWIKNQGHNVYYWKRVKDGASSSAVVQARRLAGLIRKGKIREARDYLKKTFQFRKFKTDFKTIDERSPEYDNVNCIILGSDTIWNIDRRHFVRNRDVYWGSRFEGKNIVSFAGSIANTDYDSLVGDPYYGNSIKKWKAVSVRDTYTREAFSLIADKEVSVVCDPTLLFSEDDYRSLIKPAPGDYIFLYLFDPLNEYIDRQLSEYARNHGLKIISGTGRTISSFSDETVINSPYVFLRFMLGAKYIITDTYHGTLFSINFRKQFVSINRSKNKVRNVLDMFMLGSRMIDEGKELLFQKLNEPVNYDDIWHLIDDIRETSGKYLANSIDMCKYRR